MMITYFGITSLTCLCIVVLVSVISLFWYVSAFERKVSINFNGLILLTSIAIIVVVIIGYYRKMVLRSCPGPKVEFVPKIRTFIEEQEQPSYPSNIFKKMFWGNSPWTSTETQSTYLKLGRLQPHYEGTRPKNIIVGKNQDRDDYLNSYFA